MVNLIKETIEILDNYFLGEEDIKWVGSKDGNYAMSWKTFKEVFNNVNYDAGFGRQEVAKDLVVVGKDWWLERHEYDGAEGWEFKQLPIPKNNAKCFNKILGSWDDIEDIEHEEEE